MGSKFLEGVMCGVVAGLVLQWLQPRPSVQGVVAVPVPTRPRALRVAVKPA
jgi:hypothetical protein